MWDQESNSRERPLQPWAYVPPSINAEVVQNPSVYQGNYGSLPLPQQTFSDQVYAPHSSGWSKYQSGKSERYGRPQEPYPSRISNQYENLQSQREGPYSRRENFSAGPSQNIVPTYENHHGGQPRGFSSGSEGPGEGSRFQRAAPVYPPNTPNSFSSSPYNTDSSVFSHRGLSGDSQLDKTLSVNRVPSELRVETNNDKLQMEVSGAVDETSSAGAANVPSPEKQVPLLQAMPSEPAECVTFRAKLSKITVDSASITSLSQMMRSIAAKLQSAKQLQAYLLQFWDSAMQEAAENFDAILASIEETGREEGGNTRLEKEASAKIQSTRALALLYLANDVIQLLTPALVRFKVRFLLVLIHTVARLKRKHSALFATLAARIDRICTIFTDRKMFPLRALRLLRTAAATGIVDQGELTLLEKVADSFSAEAASEKLAEMERAEEVKTVPRVPPPAIINIQMSHTHSTLAQAAPTAEEYNACVRLLQPLCVGPRVAWATQLDADMITRAIAMRTSKFAASTEEEQLLTTFTSLLFERKARAVDIEGKVTRRLNEERRGAAFELHHEENAAAARISVLLKKEWNGRRYFCELEHALFWKLVEILEFICKRRKRITAVVQCINKEKQRRGSRPDSDNSLNLIAAAATAD